MPATAGNIAWIKTLYQNPALRQRLLNYYGEVFNRYASDVWIAEGGIGQPPQGFVNGMVGDYVDHHMESSRAQLEELFTQVLDLPVDQQKQATLDRIQEWLQKRPEKVSANETIRAGNAIAVERMRSAGVTHKKWLTVGKGTCPYCKTLNGRTIEVERTFFEPGEEFKPPGAKTPLTFRSSIGHPPVHQGCDCLIEEATEVVVSDEPVRGTVEWAKEQWGTKTGPFYSGLTPEQLDAASRYSGADFKRMNKFLRKGTGGSGALQRRIDALTSAIDQTPINQTVTVRRGTTLSAFDRYHPKTFIGQEISEKGFMSTSVKGTAAADFGGYDHAVNLRITAPKGTPAMYMEPITQVKGEQEILFRPGTRMRVDRVQERTIRGRFGDRPHTEYDVYATIVG